MKATRYTQEMIQGHLQKGYWETITFPDIWDRNAAQYPDKEALVDSRTRLTWSQAKQQIDRIALGLMELGIGRDEVLVTELFNCVELMLIYVACQKAGIVNLNVIRTMRHRELEHVLKFTEASGVVIPWRFRDFDYWDMIQSIRPNLPDLKHVFAIGNEVPEGAISIAEMTRRPLEKEYSPQRLRERNFNPFEVSRIRHTSGSTGFPKLIEETASNRVYLAKELTRLIKITSEDIIGGFVQLTGGGGSYALLCAPWVGAKSVLMEHFEVEEGFKFIEQEKITVAGVVPAILAMMVQHPSLGQYDLSSLRVLVCHGAPLAPKLAQEAEGKIGCVILNRYGMADGGSMSMAFVDDPAQIRYGTVGKPHTGNEFKLIDEAGNEVPRGEAGEVLFRGPGTHAGFFKDLERTGQTYDEDGWFRTGDVGRFDEQGNLVIVDRIKDLIIRGGENIYPSEIESLLMTNSKIANAALVGMPDPVMGEKACAYVVLKPGEQLTFEEMVRFLKGQQLAAFKFPERLEIVDHFELVSDQKVDKKVLRRDITEKLQREDKI